jgi:hypothetical protein
MVREHFAAVEAQLRDCLGRWVSGMEPVAVFDHEGRFVGLTIDGIPLGRKPPIVVPVRA